MRSLLLTTLLPVAFSSVIDVRQDGRETYEGFEAFTIDLHNGTAEVLQTLKAVDYDPWLLVNDDRMDISLAPEEVGKFKELGLQYTQKIRDLAPEVRRGRPRKWNWIKGIFSLPDSAWFDNYHDYDDHVQFWRDLQSAFRPFGVSEWFSSGTSLEGRDIFGLRLSGRRRLFQRPKKAVVWHGQAHAREWITGMTLEYIAWNMIREYRRGNRDVRRFMDEYDFYIVPFVNPDGFIFSTTTQRLWRKNRRAPPAGSDCAGVDLNRNWPVQWDTNPGGSSPNPCSQAYRGTAPNSEPEMNGMVAFIDRVARDQGIKLYIDWHSFGNFILSPWGYTCNALPANNDRLVSLGRETGDVISSVFGQVFTTGPTCQTLYAVNGGSLDYVYDVARAELSYAWELRDRGQTGFLLPPDQIRPTGEENWQGMLYMLKNM